MSETSSHLYHDVLQLVVRVGYVRRRQYEQPPLLVKLIQEGVDRLDVIFNLHGCRHAERETVSSL